MYYLSKLKERHNVNVQHACTHVQTCASARSGGKSHEMVQDSEQRMREREREPHISIHQQLARESRDPPCHSACRSPYAIALGTGPRPCSLASGHATKAKQSGSQ